MFLRFSRTDWDVTALVAGVATFLSAVMYCYLWYYEQPSFEALSKRSVIVSSVNTVNWLRKSVSGGARPGPQYFEVIANSNDSQDQTRYIMSLAPNGLADALIKNKGICTLWFDPKQANEIFQIQVGDSIVLKYDDVYTLKSGGAKSWWNISLFVFIFGLATMLFYVFSLRRNKQNLRP
jgi:hypothetical protein